MNPLPRGEPIGNDTLEQAAHWFAVLQDDELSGAERDGWQRWIATSEQNRRAWARVEQIDRQFRGLPATAARNALQPGGQSRRQLFKGLAGLALAAPLGWSTWNLLPAGLGRADLRSAVGEVRESRLPDGGRLWLNTASAVQLDYSPTQRRVRLLAGEIHIQTAADARPFSVQTPAGDAMPLGTRFSVRLEADATRVAVSAGRVAVVPRLQASGRQVIETGQALRFDARQVTRAQPRAEGEAAWRTGMLVADNLPLGDFLDELARYRHGVIRYDPQAARLPLLGAYPLGDTDRILDALADTLPVTVTRVTPWWVTVTART
ncbi:MAG: FecR domain-containing protein [Pseudomonadota bacterium]